MVGKNELDLLSVDVAEILYGRILMAFHATLSVIVGIDAGNVGKEAYLTASPEICALADAEANSAAAS